MIAQYHECIKNHLIVYFEWVKKKKKGQVMSLLEHTFWSFWSYHETHVHKSASLNASSRIYQAKMH